DRRHADLPAEHRLVERHRQVEPDIVALAPVETVRADVNRDQRVAIAARPRLALPGEPDLRSVLDAGRQPDVERLAAGQGHALPRKGRRILEADLQPVGDIGALLRRPRTAEAAERASARPGAAAAAPAHAAENAFEQVGNAFLVFAEFEGLAIG